MISYSEPGHDYFNNPPHDSPPFLDGEGDIIFTAIEANLTEQCRADRQGNGVLIFRKDRFTATVDSVIDVAQLAKAVQDALNRNRQ
jgi:hypothetical protein